MGKSGKGGGAKGAGKSRPPNKPAMTKHTQAASPHPTSGGVARGAFGGRVGGGLQKGAAGGGQKAFQQAKPFTAFVDRPAKGSGKSSGKSSKGQGGKVGGQQGGKGPRHGSAAREEAQDNNPGFKGQRQRVAGGRVTGKVIAWKGPFGWIMPDSRINHPAANKRGGKIYLDQIDVEQELEGVGARVSFFVYCDEAGLGAQHVIPSKGPPVKQTIEKAKANGKPASQAKAESAEVKGKKAKGKGKGKDKKEEKVFQPPDKTKRESLEDAGNGTIVDWRGDVGWLKPDEELTHPDARAHGRRKGLLFVHSSDCEGELPLIGAQVMYSMYKDEHGLGAEGVNVLVQGDGQKPAPEPRGATEEGDASAKKQSLKKVLQKSSLLKKKEQGKGKGKGKGKKPAGEKGPSGPDLPRERLSEAPVTGEVVSWKGRIGWIKAAEDIDHPDASMRGGKLYAHIKDLVVEEGKKMERGMTVQFYVFKDASGLGAEEITVV